jgi:2-hydroxychromene-2-carboxylate isomerase
VSDLVFYYDFNSPYAYLAASRIDALLAEVQWQPAALAFILRAHDRTPWSMEEETRSHGLLECEQRAAAYGLPPLQLPPDWPVGSYGLLSLRAALAAVEQDGLKAFSRAAFERHFVAGLPLKQDSDIAVVAAVAGLDPDALLARAHHGEIKEQLQVITERAIAKGIYGIPTVEVNGQMFWGDDRLEAATSALSH